MKTLVLSNGELKEKEIGNDLEDLQEIVGGYIEVPYLSKTFFENDIDMIINEEGKFIEGLTPEIAVVKDGTYTILDIVYGNCIFASHDKEGETIGLNAKQMQIIKEELKMEVMLTDKNKEKNFMVKVLFI